MDADLSTESSERPYQHKSDLFLVANPLIIKGFKHRFDMTVHPEVILVTQQYLFLLVDQVGYTTGEHSEKRQASVFPVNFSAMIRQQRVRQLVPADKGGVIARRIFADPGNRYSVRQQRGVIVAERAGLAGATGGVVFGIKNSLFLKTGFVLSSDACNLSLTGSRLAIVSLLG